MIIPYQPMKSTLALLAGLMAMICVAGKAQARDHVRVETTENTVVIANDQVRVDYDLNHGTYAVGSVASPEDSVLGAFSRVNKFASNDEGVARSWTEREVSDELGHGRVLEITCSGANRPDLILQIALYEGEPFAALTLGVDNKTGVPLRVKELVALSGAEAFDACANKPDLRLLNGEAGAGDSRVIEKPILETANNMLITFSGDGRKHSLVLGGLTYAEFGKYLSIGDKAKADAPTSDRLERIDLRGQDPVGKLVDVGVRYLPNDRFYIDPVTANPFVALERYGLALRAANRANPNIYSFPTICGWYVSVPAYGGDKNINNTPGMVEEIEAARATGFLNYAPVATRLVPDTYADNCDQGWWDDKHWRKYNFYQEPFETSAKWGRSVTERGGIPFTYFQTGMISLDYAEQHPGHMLNNDISKMRTTGEPAFLTMHRNITECSYDYTDPGFQEHLKTVWLNLRQAGIKGVMFDYPETGWREKGGFEDKHATTASAYRKIFEIAKSGLGPDSYIHERNVWGQPFLDMTAGVVDNQRVWVDTDLSTPDMYERCALRWYKTRTLYTYDTDAKNLFKVCPNNRDGVRQTLSLVYLVSGRLLLANSFRKLPPAILHDMSRVFPVHATPKTSRPLDLFTYEGNCPRIYDLEIAPEWHQTAFFNTDTTNTATIGVDISTDTAFGGMGLDPERSYHVYDFWNDAYLGKFDGKRRLEQTLRPGEVRMMSVHAAEDHPQFISTNRHLMQGYVDLKDVKWRWLSRKLTGTAEVVGGETYKVVIATNGRTPKEAEAEGAEAKIKMTDPEKGLATLSLDRAENGGVAWEVKF